MSKNMTIGSYVEYEYEQQKEIGRIVFMKKDKVCGDTFYDLCIQRENKELMFISSGSVKLK